MDQDGRKRVVIQGVFPEIDCGRFPIKRAVGDTVHVEADVFTDGHEAVRSLLLYRKRGDSRWRARPMSLLVNDRWSGQFQVTDQGFYEYTLYAWVDTFQTWRRNLLKKTQAGQGISVELLTGEGLIRKAAGRASGDDKARLNGYADLLLKDTDSSQKFAAAAGKPLEGLMAKYPDTQFASRYDRVLSLWVDRPKARFSSWYEMFPRSCGDGGRHGTFQDCASRISYAASMGFDVVYFPPIHPIGSTNRKGPNNSPAARPGDPGSPWAIGSQLGGHRSVHDELGTLEEFRELISTAKEKGVEVAIDLAFQCSPDHPWVKEHPEWFRWRPDNTVQFAENPPKKYEDIYPLNFECDQWQELWLALKGVVDFWIQQGVRIFRVDNPHTKPFPFWEWLLSSVREAHPGIIFLSEAFTRPNVMYRLAKLGFSQSYTYFAWRNTKWEIETYFEELLGTEVGEYFRPNLWPNTPDILTEYLQTGGRPAFMARLVLAATLSANYGIYGPAFELMENLALEWGSEEYRNSEKYEIRRWEIDRSDSLKDFITRINRIRRENPALQQDGSLRFLPIDNDQLICYSKQSDDRSNIIIVVVNLDPHHAHGGWLQLPLAQLGIDPERSFQVHDLLGEGRFLWTGSKNYVALDPQTSPAHIFRIRRKVRTERDFDYFM